MTAIIGDIGCDEGAEAGRWGRVGPVNERSAHLSALTSRLTMWDSVAPHDARGGAAQVRRGRADSPCKSACRSDGARALAPRLASRNRRHGGGLRFDPPQWKARSGQDAAR